jgi:hypothetical protein
MSIPFSTSANINNFLLGIAAEEALNNKEKEKAFKRLDLEVSRINNNLRESYDALIPNVFVADCVSFTNLIVNRLKQNPEKFYDDPNVGKDIIKAFADTNSPEYKALLKRIVRLVGLYHAKLLKEQNTTNPILELNNLARKLFSRTRNIENVVSARVLGVDFGKNIRKVFGNRSVLAAIDPGLGSSNTVFVFFSSSFNSIGNSFRNAVYDPLLQYIRTRLGYVDTSSKLTIGSIVNLGHAALVNDLGGWVNSPAFAKTLFTVASGGSKKFAPKELEQAASFFKKESRIIENKIEVSKELTSVEEGYGILLSLGVTFTNFEDAVINSDRGRRYEGPTVRLIGDSKVQPLSTKQKDILTNKLFRLVLRANPILARSGKNIKEFIEESFVNIIQGKKTKSVKYKYQKTQKSLKTVFVPVNKKITEKQKTKVSTKLQPLDISKVQEKSPADLLTLINSRLHDTIKANMGTGDNRDVLNYRSGRFATSVKVERLSTSRMGMITAFYTYMKNPYATFSGGGLQQFPRSRDPKLLISRSIRQIASDLVTNQLRAVNV